MKKKPVKLELHRETLRVLVEPASLRVVIGAASQFCPTDQTTCTCTTTDP